MIRINFSMKDGKPVLKADLKQLVPINEDNNLGIFAEVDLSSENKNVNIGLLQPEQDSKLMKLLGADPVLQIEGETDE